MNKSQPKTGQRKLRNIFVDGSFQIKVVFLSVGIVMIQAIIGMGYFVYTGTEFMDKTLPLLTNMDQIQEALKTVYIQLLVAFAIVNIDCLIVALVLSIYFSHKTAGPTFVIKRAINRILDGVEHEKIILRKGDEYHDLAERINLLFSDMKLKCDQCDRTVSDAVSEEK